MSFLKVETLGKRGSLLVPSGVLALLWLTLAGYILLTFPQLPARVATHFGADGAANGWMSRAGHARFTLGCAAATPLFILILFAWIRHRDGAGLNVPNRDYWLAPERREATLAFVTRHGIWLACWIVVFFASIHRQILTANSRLPAALSPSALATTLVVVFISVAVWIAVLVRRFARKT